MMYNALFAAPNLHGPLLGIVIDATGNFFLQGVKPVRAWAF